MKRAIAFEKPVLARVFLKQFEKDWKHSESEYEKVRNRVYEAPPMSGTKLDVAG